MLNYSVYYISPPSSVRLCEKFPVGSNSTYCDPLPISFLLDLSTTVLLIRRN